MPIPYRSALSFFTLGSFLLVVYGESLATGFASEDFLILGELSRRGWLETIAAEVSGPWLGLGFLGFYRPVSTAVLATELEVFGLAPVAFHVAHLLLLAACACLAAALVRRLAPSVPPTFAAAVAILFGLYPLHPSAVLFTGAFATPIGGTFVLLAVFWYLGFRATARFSHYFAALSAAGLALLSYEASAVLPLILASVELFAAEHLRPLSRGHRVALLVPFFLVLALYLAARRLVLGVTIGGYAALRARFFAGSLERVGDFFASLPQLALPESDRLCGRAGLVALGVLLLIVAGVATWADRLPGAGDRRRLLGLGVVWVGLFQLPFGLVGVVPANGRYWYLASLGILLLLGALVLTLGARLSPRVRVIGGVVLVASAATVQLAGLRHDLDLYLAADLEMTRMRAALHEAARQGEGPLLVAAPPDFVHNQAGKPVAKLFQYGLSEAVRPPFGQIDDELFPLPSSVRQDRWTELALAAGGRLRRFDPESGELEPVGPETGAIPGRIVVDAMDLQGRELRFSCAGCRMVELLAVTSVLTFRSERFAVREGGGRVPLPMDVFEGVAGLGAGAAFVWLEERAPNGSLVSASEVRAIELNGWANSRSKVSGGV